MRFYFGLFRALSHRREAAKEKREIQGLLPHLRDVGETAFAVGVLVFLIPQPAVFAQDSGGNGAQASSGEMSAEQERFYRIGPQDSLAIEVYNQPDLSMSVPVRPDGRITVPPLEDIAVVGLTPPEAADKIEERLSAYVRDPRVTVYVEGAQGMFQDRIKVLGEGVSPTAVPYREGMTALDVLTAIGGLPPTAKGNDAYLLRRSDGGHERIPVSLDDLQEGEIGQNVRIQPGDSVVVPEGFFSGEWRVSRSVSVTQAFTDNEGLDSSGEREPAFIRQISPSISISGEAARFRGSLAGRLNLRQQTLNDESTEVRPNIGGTSTFEWSRDTFFTDLSGNISQQPIDDSSALSASPLNQSNQRTVQSYRVSPYLINRFGRLARLQTRYTGGLVLSGDSDNGGSGDSDSNTHTLSADLSSGPAFSRLGWGVSASASEVNRSGDDDLSRRSVIGDLDYGLTQGFALRGRVGYEEIEGGDVNDTEVDDPVLMGGFRWTPSPRTSVNFLGGKRFGDTSFEADLRQQIGPRTNWTVSYDEAVETSPERLLRTLPGTDDDPLDIFDSDDPLDRLDPDNPLRLPFEFRDATTLTRTLRSTLSTQFGRNSISLTGAWDRDETEIGSGTLQDESYTASLGFSRPLRRDLGFDASVSYRRFDEEAFTADTPDRRDHTYRSSLGVSYSGVQGMTVTTRYALSVRDSNLEDQDFVENLISLSASFAF